MDELERLRMVVDFYPWPEAWERRLYVHHTGHMALIASKKAEA